MIKELVIGVSVVYLVRCAVVINDFAKKIDKRHAPNKFNELKTVCYEIISKNKASTCWMAIVTILLGFGIYAAVVVENSENTSGKYVRRINNVDDLSIILSSLHANLNVYGEENPASVGTTSALCQRYSEIKQNMHKETLSALTAQQSIDLNRTKDICSNMQQSYERLEVFKDIVTGKDANPMSILAHINNLNQFEKNLWDTKFGKSVRPMAEILEEVLNACNAMLENLLEEYQVNHSRNIANSITNLENEVGRAGLAFNKVVASRLDMLHDDQEKRKQALFKIVTNYIRIKNGEVSKEGDRLELLKDITDDGLVYNGGVIRPDDEFLSAGEHAALVGSIEQKHQIVYDSVMPILALHCDAASGDGRVAEFLKNLTDKLEKNKIKVSSTIRRGSAVLNVSDISIQKKEVYSSTGETLFLFSARPSFRPTHPGEDVDMGVIVGEASSKDSVQGIAKARNALVDKIVWNVAALIKNK
jgi:hypothetical protein